MNINRKLLGWILCCFLAVSSLTAGTLPYTQPVATSQVQSKETVVYTTKTGKKYHKDGCQYLRQSKIKTTKKKAISDGFGACSVCKP